MFPSPDHLRDRDQGATIGGFLAKRYAAGFARNYRPFQSPWMVLVFLLGAVVSSTIPITKMMGFEFLFGVFEHERELLFLAGQDSVRVLRVNATQ